MNTFQMTIERASEITGVKSSVIREIIEMQDMLDSTKKINGTLEGKGYISTVNLKPSPDGPVLVYEDGTEVLRMPLLNLIG